jgi:protocatechuate 3,4-dioxygenase beta subunit
MKIVTSFRASRLLASIAVPLSAASFLPAAPVPTAEVTEGPFHPFNSRNTLPVIPEVNRDNDLTRIAGATNSAQGMPFLLSGVVRDRTGKPVEGVKVELWQTDDHGVYYHSGDRRVEQRDRNFQFYGESVTGSDGAYSFRTVKPGLYSGRIRHFHYKVKRGDVTLLTSQFTFDDERADFSKDGVQRRLSGEALETTVITPQPGTDPSGEKALIAVKDIVVDQSNRAATDGAPERDRKRKRR